jgi:hypothetical protein
MKQKKGYKILTGEGSFVKTTIFLGHNVAGG